MTFRKYVISLSTALAFSALLAASVAAQKPSATPRQEKLLNGLKILVWNDPAADKVSLKLRIHGGSAFDPQEKEGVMKLLSESFFPTAESKSFFRDELDGSLEIVSNYDYIQIDATAKGGDFLTLFETIAQAVSTPDLGKDAASSLKNALAADLKEVEKDPAYVADRAAAKRLFGSFPYGRPQMGSTASLQKIDFADLIFAKERLLTADNATLAITGNVDPALVFRAARRYFGAWLKADKKIPSTFRQPDAPPAAAVEVSMPGIANSEVRYAVRGFARSSREFPAAEVYGRILQTRFQSIIAKNSGSDAAVSHDEHILPGAYVFRYKSQPTPTLLAAAAPLQPVLSPAIADAEFTAAKSAVLAEYDARDAANLWLDVDTFKITSAADERKAFQNVTLADVAAVAQKLAREPLAIAFVSGTATSSSK